MKCWFKIRIENQGNMYSIIRDYQDYLSLLFSTYLINENNCRDLTAMKECNVNHMKLFKPEEKYITVKMDI